MCDVMLVCVCVCVCSASALWCVMVQLEQARGKLVPRKKFSFGQKRGKRPAATVAPGADAAGAAGRAGGGGGGDGAGCGGVAGEAGEGGSGGGVAEATHMLSGRTGEVLVVRAALALLLSLGLFPSGSFVSAPAAAFVPHHPRFWFLVYCMIFSPSLRVCAVGACVLSVCVCAQVAPGALAGSGGSDYFLKDLTGCVVVFMETLSALKVTELRSDMWLQ